MKTVLIVGFGEIGKSMHAIITDSSLYRVYKKDMENLEIEEHIDFMHICIPHSDGFNKIVLGYLEKYNPSLTIINSTVPPGTTQMIHDKSRSKLVHSPVRGRHPDLSGGMLKFVKFIGPTSRDAGDLAKAHFEAVGIRTEVLSSAVETELGKLLSTTYYAVNIAFHQDMQRICDHYGADFEQAVTRFSDTATLDIEHKIPRPLMYPGVIGGHCLMSNIKILKKDLKSDFLDAIEKSNEKAKLSSPQPNCP